MNGSTMRSLLLLAVLVMMHTRVFAQAPFCADGCYNDITGDCICANTYDGLSYDASDNWTPGDKTCAKVTQAIAKVGCKVATKAGGLVAAVVNKLGSGVVDKICQTIVCKGLCSAACPDAPGKSSADCGHCDEKCFPSNATVTLLNGTSKRMDELAIGDKVLVASGVFSDVYMFSHKLSAVQSEFVSITTQGGHTLMLTSNHYLYINNRMAVASMVKVGDTLTTPGSTDKYDKVVSVRNVWADGLYNPHTLQGDIVVNGVLTSTYTSAIEPNIAHAALLPVRMMYSMGIDLVGDKFAEGSEFIAKSMPDGQKEY